MMRARREMEGRAKIGGPFVKIGILVILAAMLIPVWSVNAAPPDPPGDLGEYYDHTRGKAADYYWNEGSGVICADDSGRNKFASCFDQPFWDNGRDHEMNAVRISNQNNYWSVASHSDFNFGTDFAITCVVSVDENAGDLVSFCDKRGYGGGPFYEVESGFFFGLENGHLTYRQWRKDIFPPYHVQCLSVQYTGYDYRDDPGGPQPLWHFFAYRNEQTENGMTFTLYADSDQIDYHCVADISYDFIKTPQRNNNPLIIGAINGNPVTGFLSGKMDDLHLYEFPRDITYCGWGKDNYAYFGMDDVSLRVEPDDTVSYFTNDRLTWDHHLRGISKDYLGCTDDKIYGAGSRVFNGKNNHITFSSTESVSFVEDDDLYIECWFKCENLSANRYEMIIDKYTDISQYGANGYSLFIDSDHKLNFEIADNYILNVQGTHGRIFSATVIQDEILTGPQWYHVWAWFDNDNNKMGLSIELNNLQLERQEINYYGNIGSAFPNQPLYFGVREYYAGKDHYFTGKIDEVVISGFDV